MRRRSVEPLPSTLVKIHPQRARMVARTALRRLFARRLLWPEVRAYRRPYLMFGELAVPRPASDDFFEIAGRKPGEVAKGLGPERTDPRVGATIEIDARYGLRKR